MTPDPRHTDAASRVETARASSPPRRSPSSAWPEQRSRLRAALFGPLGGAALFLVVGGLLNALIWHHGSRRVEQEAWQRFGAAADERRADLDQVLAVLRREARSVVADPDVRRAVLAVRASGTEESRRRPLHELFDRAQGLEFQHVAVLGEDGRVIVLQQGADAATASPHADVAREAMADGGLRWIVPHEGEIAIVLPVGDEVPARRAVLLHTDARRMMAPLRREWPGFGAGSGAFVFRVHGDRVEFLSAPALGRPNGLQERFVRRDAEGRARRPVAVTFEHKGPGPAVWYAARPLEDMGWGIVAEAERREMLAGLGPLAQMLFAFDALLVLGFLVGLSWWRRSYADGLAQREAEVVERQARRVQAILDNAFDAILTFDPDGRVLSVNRAAAVLLRTSPTALVDAPVQDLLAWDAAERPHALPPTGAVVAGHALTGDGARIPVEFAIARSGQGAEVVYTAIVRDVLERVEAETRAREAADELVRSHRRLEETNARLEAAVRVKSEFLANTSHELRTPLNGMIGFLQLVLEGSCRSREEEQEFLRQSLACSQQLLGLINDVLDRARLEAGRMVITSERLDVASLFAEVRTAVHAQALQRGLRLAFEDAVPRGVAAHGDPQRVRQVLVNLVGNSLKFTPQGSIVVRASVPRGSDEVRFEVRDTGIGIAPDRQQAVFEAFVQADGSTTRRYGGSGLGLAIGRGLVELMGGRIGLESAGEGKGTTAWFTLPRHDAVRSDRAGRAA